MFKKMLRSYDYAFIIAVLLLCCFGLVMVYSSSMVVAVSVYGKASDFFYQKQKIFLILSVVVFFIFAFFPYKVYAHKRFQMTVMLGVIGSLILILIFGHAANNAQSWFRIGPIAVQPAEFAKLGVIMYMAAMLARKQQYINEVKKSITKPVGMLVIIIFLIMMQPDYGSAMIIIAIAMTIIFSSGLSFKTIAKLSLLGLIMIGIILGILQITGNMDLLLSKGRLSRFTGFMHPFDDVQHSGYQLVNSFIAVAQGGMKGLGLGHSIQKTGYLPEPHTDFISAIISEELGTVGVCIFLFLLFFIVAKGLRIAQRCPDAFGSLLAIGISSMIGIQTVINLGAAIGLLPITGVTLPFISYGGSSLILLMLSVGVLANISMVSNMKRKYAADIASLKNN